MLGLKNHSEENTVSCILFFTTFSTYLLGSGLKVCCKVWWLSSDQRKTKMIV